MQFYRRNHFRRLQGTFFNNLWEHLVDMEKKHEVEKHRNHQQKAKENREEVHLVAHGFQVFDEFLLFERVGVGGFTDHFELILESLERSGLFNDVGTEIEMLN